MQPKASKTSYSSSRQKGVVIRTNVQGKILAILLTTWESFPPIGNPNELAGSYDYRIRPNIDGHSDNYA